MTALSTFACSILGLLLVLFLDAFITHRRATKKAKRLAREALEAAENKEEWAYGAAEVDYVFLPGTCKVGFRSRVETPSE